MAEPDILKLIDVANKSMNAARACLRLYAYEGAANHYRAAAVLYKRAGHNLCAAYAEKRADRMIDIGRGVVPA